MVQIIGFFVLAFPKAADQNKNEKKNNNNNNNKKKMDADTVCLTLKYQNTYQ